MDSTAFKGISCPLRLFEFLFFKRTSWPSSLPNAWWLVVIAQRWRGNSLYMPRGCIICCVFSSVSCGSQCGSSPAVQWNGVPLPNICMGWIQSWPSTNRWVSAAGTASRKALLLKEETRVAILTVPSPAAEKCLFQVGYYSVCIEGMQLVCPYCAIDREVAAIAKGGIFVCESKVTELSVKLCCALVQEWCAWQPAVYPCVRCLSEIPLDLDLSPFNSSDPGHQNKHRCWWHGPQSPLFGHLKE